MARPLVRDAFETFTNQDTKSITISVEAIQIMLPSLKPYSIGNAGGLLQMDLSFDDTSLQSMVREIDFYQDDLRAVLNNCRDLAFLKVIID